MKKKGFTLIELLAVILILGIIALIAIPTVNKILKEARQGALKSSIQQIYKGAENYYTIQSMKNIEADDLLFDLTESESFKALAIKSKTFDSGYLVLTTSGEVIINVVDSGFCAYTDENKKIIITDDVNSCGIERKIEYIEDLVDISKEVYSGIRHIGVTLVLKNDLDFQNDDSYKDPSSTSYGDINKDGTINTIKEELTTSTGFYPIGKENKVFYGNVNGNNYTIKNLYINRNSEKQALFGEANIGTFTNLTVEGNVNSAKYAAILIGESYKTTLKNITINGNLSGSEPDVGLLIGKCDDIEASNIKVSGTVIGYAENIGGIIGRFEGKGILSNSKSNVNVKGNHDVGGIVGEMDHEVKVISSLSEGNVTATGENSDSMGGITGSIKENSLIDDCQNNMTISGYQKLGGIAGDVDYEESGKHAIIQNSYFSGIINTHLDGAKQIGGLVGHNRGYIYNSYSNGTINVNNASVSLVGGIVGDNGKYNISHKYVLVNHCYFTGTINTQPDTSIVGSLVGRNGSAEDNEAKTKYETLKNSYSIANISGNDKIGLVGSNIMIIKDVYNGGQVTGTSNTGNIVGITEASNAQCNNCYSIKQNNTLTNIIGTELETVTSNDFQNRIEMGNRALKYENGYYPLLYKRTGDDAYSNQLVRGQTKIPIN